MLLTPNSPHADCAYYTNIAYTYPATATSNAANAASASRSWHKGGVNALFADGGVHFIKDSVSQQTWWSLGTIAGNEVISSDSINRRSRALNSIKLVELVGNTGARRC